MNKTRKVELLYKKAKGEFVNVSPQEARELKRYRVNYNESKLYATKANISKYITAVDSGYRAPFYDWCIENRSADRRRKGSSEREIARNDKEGGISTMMIGWITWGLAIYHMLHGTVEAGGCAILGMIVSYFIRKSGRGNVGFTVFLLPIILAVVFGS